ncbi:hypothetical protein D3C87_1684440 [compost metagenome]
MAEAAGLDADLRIAGTVTRDRRSGPAKFGEGIDQEFRIALVKRQKRIDGGNRIVKRLWFENVGRCDGKGGEGRDSIVHTAL